MKHFGFEEETVKQKIHRLGAKRVLIQLPEGLKPEALRLAKIVEKAGALPIVSADPCYGACDLATEEAESLGADLLVHFGHSKLFRHEHVPTLYVEARANANVDNAVRRALPLLKKWRRIGLVTTVQHVQTLDSVREVLTRAGKTVVIGDTGQLSYPGQVIGCQCSNAASIVESVDAFLFVGGGQFHALGVALSTSRPTVVADPYENRAFSVDKEAQKIVKQRWACIQEARSAKNFGVLIGLKPGQKRLKEAMRLKQKLEENGQTACLFAVREVSPEMILRFPSVDAYVNTACPRISFDDASRFRKPVLTAKEALVVLGELSWEELCKEGLLGN
jgi:2-(3-amino-3-carboxypropyl)histidine synthase